MILFYCFIFYFNSFIIIISIFVIFIITKFGYINIGLCVSLIII